MAASMSPQPAPLALDTRRRFVRLRGERGNGFIEFEFAIGEPEIFVELILGRDAFADFCATNAVQMLPAAGADGAAQAARCDWDWRLADATAIRFKPIDN